MAGSTLQRTNGLNESNLAQGTGLRTRSYAAMLVTNAAGIVASFAPTRGASTWTTATILNGRCNYPTTICVTVNQSAAPTTGTVQFRVRGLDQFGNYHEELTPVVNAVAKTNNFVYLAKVFSVVYEFAYKLSAFTGATMAVTVGQRFDWTRTIDASNEHLNGQNLGIGIPITMDFRPRGAPSGTARLGADSQAYQPRASTGTLTFALNAANGETVTIDGIVYTFKNALASANDVLVGGSASASCDNLFAAINLVPSGSGTLYHAGTSAHTSVRALTSASGVLTVQAKNPGADGNLIATTETLAGANNVWTNATLTGGYSEAGEVTGVTIQDFSASGTMTVMSPTDYTIGKSDVGWEGTIEKLSILKVAAVGTYVTGDGLFMAMQLLTRDSGW